MPAPMTVARRPPGPASANLQWRCYGAGVGEDIVSVDVDVNRWRQPHAEVERPEPIPHASQTGWHADRRDRDEPFELARCGDCAWHRAPAVEEARGRREHLAEAAHSLARGSEEVRTQHRTHRGRLRRRPGRVLAGALAQGARHRGPYHPRNERSRIARAPARQDRSSRHRVAQTRLSRLVAWWA